MTTTEPSNPPAAPAAAPATEAPKKEHSILDAMKRGRELATAMVLVLTFIHSMYASYFKKEEVAEAGYKTTSETIEGYSREVRDQIETLKLRVESLEDELVKVKMVKVEDTSKTKPPKFIPPFVKIEGVQIESSMGFPVAVSMPISDSDGISDLAPAPDDDPLIVNMPERPWEQMQKKE
jgi:hypothetical protein